uniref:CHAT domain-containing protein n=1 Tax=Bionectria ochroleuca TaxID=29856 RepID=A0A0B7K4C7_BIOOC
MSSSRWTAPHSPERARKFGRVASIFRRRYDKSRATGDLKTRIILRYMALNLTSDEDPRKADRYAALALEYSQKHAETKSLVDLETIIWHRQKALKLTLPGDPQYEIYLWRLVEELRMKYDATGGVSDLDMVLESRKHLIDLAPGVGFKRQINLKLLGTEYGYRYGKTKSLLDFEEAVRHYKSAIELNPNDILLVPGISEDLSAIFDKRYKESNEEEYLDVSITYGEMAVNSTPEGKIRKVWRLHDLGYKYYSKFSISHSLLDIEQAINYTRQALALAPETSHERRFRLFRSLGSCFEAKCLETHSVDDLLASIQYKECAFALGSHHREGRQRLCKFIGGDFTTLYQMTMHLPYLETGIQKLNHFVNEVLVDNPMEILECLAKLAYAYEVRHRRTGEKADLDTLIQQYGLCLTQEGRKDRPGLLRSLADFHLLRHERSESIVDFETAVQFYHQALDSTPIDDPLRGLRLRSLGAIYTEKYVISKSDADFDAATQYLETSLGNQFHDQRSVSSTLSAFYDCYMRKYQVTKALEDLNAAIHFWEQMFHHSSQYPYTNSVSEATGPAYALWIRYYRHMGEEVDRQAAINNFRLVLDSDRASVRDKRLAGELLLFAHAKDGEWTSAYQTARKTVHLLSSLAHHALDNHDKQYFLADEMSPLASDAAALAIMAGEDVYEAIELLELGRGVIMNALNARRLDLSSLREECPSLAQEFVTLRDQLYALHQSPLENIDQRHEISNKFEQSISNIRKLKGFEHFLRPHSKSDMHAFAQRGPVVIVNASSYRCDAFIIDQASMYTVPLPQLRLSGIKERITKLQHLNSDLLEWLWDTIAIHVLNKLGFSQKPQDDDMPRIWWVLTGPLSKFPIHAAGYHKQNSAQTVLDRVISSYGSSFAMLIYGGDQVDKPQETGKAVIVGTKDLFYVTEEIEKVTDICSSMKLGIVRPLPRRKDIQSAMDNCTIFHFAGHGRVNNLNPLKSHLVLEGDSLTLDDVLESNLSSHPPFLAYLSACGTGQIGKDELVDEGLHLISAFHAGGFQNVIGTLWVVDDRICMDVATETYKWIAQNQMRSRSVSEGLHRTVKNLRDRWILANTEDRGDTLKGTGRAQKVSLKSRDMIPVETDSPLLWVPFVHYGV